jgi:hypothetical protein
MLTNSTILRLQSHENFRLTSMYQTRHSPKSYVNKPRRFIFAFGSNVAKYRIGPS